MRRSLALALAALALAPSAADASVSSTHATVIASRLALVRREERTHPGAFSQVSSPIAGQWQVAFYSRGQEFVQVIVSASSGRALGQYTGIQVAWTMARGYPGAFGRHLDALYIWLPLCLFFLAPFFDWRRPLRMLNLDLLVLTSLSVSLAFFNHAAVNVSVPLVYPPLVYLLLRLLWLARRGGYLHLATGDSCDLQLALFGDLFKCAAGAIQGRLPARQPLPPLHHHVNVLWVQLNAVADALGDFRGGQGRSRSEERLVDRLPALGVVQQRAPHEFDRLLGRVIELFLIRAAHYEFGGRASPDPRGFARISK